MVEWPLTNGGNARVLGSRWKSWVLCVRDLPVASPRSLSLQEPNNGRRRYHSASLCPGGCELGADRWSGDQWLEFLAEAKSSHVV